MFLKFVIKTYIKGIFNPSFANNSDLFKGIRFYKSVKCWKKNIVQVYKECKYLYKYWNNSWPDTYFRFAMFMNNFSDMDQMKSFVPQQAYYKYILQTAQNKKYNILIDDKILCHDILSFYGIPVPERLFVFRNNTFRCKEQLLSDEEVDAKLSLIDDDIIFVKYFTGGGASGISILKLDEQDGKYKDENNNVISASLIREMYPNQSIIFERKINQNTLLAKFNKDTVNTIRVLTYNNEVISASVRFGRKGCFVDNIVKGGIAISLDINTGEFGEWGVRNYELKRYYIHPDTQIPFKGSIIKEWDEVKKLVERVCRMMPYYKSVGFDIAMTPNGPVIIEINTGAGIYLSQAGKEYGLGNFFKNQKL